MPSGLDEMQPCHRVATVGITPLRRQHADAAIEPPGRERQDHLTGRIEPLNVVDGDQQRHVDGDSVDNGGECGGDHVLICGGATVARPQQHPVDGETLHLRQPRDHLLLHPTE